MSAGNLNKNEAAAKLRLYTSPGSPCGRRVAIAMLEKGLVFEAVVVDLSRAEQKSETYLNLNPNGYVPTVSHGGSVIFDSSVILDYLEDQFPESPLMSVDPVLRAETRQWIGAEQEMARLFRPIMYQRLMGPLNRASRNLDEALAITRKQSDDPADLAWAEKVWKLDVLDEDGQEVQVDRLLSWLDVVEDALQGKTWLVDNAFGLAEIALYPRIAMFAYIGIHIGNLRYPNVNAWMQRLEKRPSFRASMSAQEGKLDKLARSGKIAKLAGILSKDENTRGLGDRLFLKLFGKVLRKVQGVDALLKPGHQSTPLPLPHGEIPSFQHLPLRQAEQLSSPDTITLYGHPDWPESNAIVSLLEKLGLSYDVIMVDIANDAHKDPEFLALNPHGTLPLMLHGDIRLQDSRSIAEYLIAIAPDGASLSPLNSRVAADIRQWQALEAGGNKEFLPVWAKYHGDCPDQAPFPMGEELAVDRIKHRLGLVEKQLTRQDYLAASHLSFADLLWSARWDSLSRVPGISLADYPAIAAWQTRLAEA